MVFVFEFLVKQFFFINILVPIGLARVQVMPAHPSPVLQQQNSTEINASNNNTTIPSQTTGHIVKGNIFNNILVFLSFSYWIHWIFLIVCSLTNQFYFFFIFLISGLIRDDKDKFKCLYLLVETAVAVRQREKEQDDVHVLGN